MTAVDAQSLELGSSSAVSILGGQRIVVAGSSAGVSGFDAFGRVYVSVAVGDLRGDGGAAVAFTVEQSADGASWSSAAAALTFTTSGVKVAAVDGPTGWLRVSWSVAGVLRSCKVTGVSVTPGSLDTPAGGGGGGSPAGADGQIQFNDADEFGASPDFVWDTEGKVLRLNADDGGTAEIRGGAIGVQLQLSATPGDADYPGGAVVVTAGNSDGQDGGDVQVSAGSDFSEFGSAGGVSIKSGSSINNNGGDITIYANPDAAAGWNGGDITIVAGQGSHTGGDVRLQAGGSVGSPGSVQMYSGDSNQSIELNNSGLFLPGVIDVSSLPTSNPGPGLMWNNAGTLKVGT